MVRVSQNDAVGSHPREVDQIVRQFIVEFGSDAASWYLLGSHAEGSAIDLSDIDLLCLFRRPVGVAGFEWGAHVEKSYGGRVDIYMQHPQSINTVLNAHVLAMLGRAVLIQGVEQRGSLPAINVRAYQESVSYLLGRAVEHYHPDRSLNSDPRPSDAFLGFVERAPRWTGVETWTHPIVVLLGNGARAGVSTDGRVAASRQESVDRFMQCQDCLDWPTFCAESIALLRSSWRYRVPATTADRDRLRDVCSRLRLFAEFCVKRLSAAGIPIYRVTRS